MAWLRLESSFAQHRKVRRLAKILDVPIYAARGLIAGLLCRVCEESPDGSLDDWLPEDISFACDWSGDHDQLVAALESARLIVEANGRREVNNWMKYADGFKDALRARKYRENKKKRAVLVGKNNETSRDGHATITPPSRDRHIDGRTDGPTNNIVELDATDEPAERPEMALASTADAAGLSVTKRKNGKKPSAAEVDAIWQHYRAHHQRAVVTLRRGRKEYRLIERALEDFGADDVRKAIDGYHRSPWHTGTNPSGKQYLGIDLILRDASKIQAGIEMAEPRSSGGGPRTLVDYRPGAHDTNH